MADKALCSILDCRNQVYCRGWCKGHYSRWQEKGDPGTTPIRVRFDAMPYLVQAIENHGSDDCLIWPYYRNEFGYGRLRHDGKNVLVCRAVCEITYGPPPSPKHEAAHNCGNGHLGCFAPRHLRWATHLENMRDTVVHGTSVRGEAKHGAILKEADVREIRRRRAIGEQFKSIAADLGVSVRTIHAIAYRKSWAWLI